jgi:hypothetical protein
MRNEMLVHGKRRKATRMEMKPFSGINIMTIKTVDGSWVLWNPLPDLVGENLARNTLYNKRVEIVVEVGGKEVVMEFVSKYDFTAATIISEKNPDLFDFVVRLLIIVEETGVAPVEMVAADVADSPTVQMAQTLLRNSIDAARAEKMAREAEKLARETAEQHVALKQEVVALDGRVDIVESTANEAHKLAKATQGEATAFPLVKWAMGRGINLDPNGDGREEGQFLSDKHLGLYGKRPRKTRTEAYPEGVNVYPEELLLRWERYYLSRHPKVVARLKGR